MSNIYKKTYTAELLPFDEGEALRYFGYKKNGGMPEENVKNVFDECVKQALPVCDYRICYAEFSVTKEGNVLDLGFTETDSRSLQIQLEGCEKIIVFAATVGIGIDRLIARYKGSSPAHAYAMQAIGAERVETLCNVFNREITEKYGREGWYTTPRFSCGYGDFPLEKQKDFFVALDCNRKIGVSLTDSLLMIPSKSVTALIGLSQMPRPRGNSREKCAGCHSKDCPFKE